ncbi:MAG TPA: P-II family nitrogen regulator [Bacteroidales bacterium]|nr:P-II family nitrogen regulator [Bacteroidales bacterium]
MKEIKAIIRPTKVDEVIDAIENLPDSPGLTISEVQGWGHTRDRKDVRLTRRVKLEVVVPDEKVEKVLACIEENARTGEGHFGDGIIFVSEVGQTIRIRTGQRGESVLHPEK